MGRIASAKHSSNRRGVAAACITLQTTASKPATEWQDQLSPKRYLLDPLSYDRLKSVSRQTQYIEPMFV